MDLRGAKSNVMSLIGTYRNRNCPRVALFGRFALACAQGYSLRTVALAAPRTPGIQPYVESGDYRATA